MPKYVFLPKMQIGSEKYLVHLSCTLRSHTLVPAKAEMLQLPRKLSVIKLYYYIRYRKQIVWEILNLQRLLLWF